MVGGALVSEPQHWEPRHGHDTDFGEPGNGRDWMKVQWQVSFGPGLLALGVSLENGISERRSKTGGRGKSSGAKGRPIWHVSQGAMVDLTGEESNLLFRVLEEWEAHLAHLDPDGLERDNDNINT